jgi:hypothetical protein
MSVCAKNKEFFYAFVKVEAIFLLLCISQIPSKFWYNFIIFTRTSYKFCLCYRNASMNMTNPKVKTTYAIAIIALGLALSSSLIAPALAAKSGTSGVHFQGPAPTITKSGDTATSTAFTLAGLGQGSGTATLTVTGVFQVQCRNPGGNIAPGQDTTATGTSGDFGFTSQNGKASIPSLTATLNPNTVDTSNSCPNSSWTPIVGSGTVTSATLTVKFNGETIFQTTA